MTSQAIHPSVEERLAALEAAVNELREQTGNQGKGNWLKQITGSFKDDPVFDKILRYGGEFRQSDYLGDDRQEAE